MIVAHLGVQVKEQCRRELFFRCGAVHQIDRIIARKSHSNGVQRMAVIERRRLLLSLVDSLSGSPV